MLRGGGQGPGRLHLQEEALRGLPAGGGRGLDPGGQAQEEEVAQPGHITGEGQVRETLAVV